MKNGRNILILVGVAIVAYLLLNYFNKPKASNQNTGTGGGNTSGAGSTGGGSGSTGGSRPIYTTTSVNVGSVVPLTGAISGLEGAINEQKFSPISPIYAGKAYVDRYYKGGKENGGGYLQWVVDNYYQFPIITGNTGNAMSNRLYIENWPHPVQFKGALRYYPLLNFSEWWFYEVEPNLEQRITPDGELFSMHNALHTAWHRDKENSRVLFFDNQRALLQPQQDGKWIWLRNF